MAGLLALMLLHHARRPARTRTDGTLVPLAEQDRSLWDRDLITGLVHQSLLAVLGAAAGVMAVLLLSSGGGPEVTESVDLFAVLGYGLLGACWLVLKTEGELQDWARRRARGEGSTAEDEVEEVDGDERREKRGRTR